VVQQGQGEFEDSRELKELKGQREAPDREERLEHPAHAAHKAFRVQQAHAEPTAQESAFLGQEDQPDHRVLKVFLACADLSVRWVLRDH
jgi:hypothetical protein